MPVGDHITEDTFELHSTGQLEEREAARVKKHLIACEACRGRLGLADGFIATLRQEEDPSPGKLRRRSGWALLKVILGSAIGLGYVYNIAVGGLPESDASSLEKLGYGTGTVVGILAGAVLVLSGLRGMLPKR